MKDLEVKSLIQDFTVMNQEVSFEEKINFVKKIKRKEFSIRNHFTEIRCKKETNFNNCFLETNYDNHFLKMLVSTKCIFRDGDVKEENFPFPEELLGKKEKLFFDLVSINDYSSAEEIKKEMRSKGFKPANLFQLFSLARDFPYLQVKYPIVALGSCWIDVLAPISCDFPAVLVPYLDVIGDKRALRSACSSSKWSPKFKFLAVKA